MAGFHNETFSTSLARLSRPTDIFVDAIGNMHIVDSNNGRILYWPVNSLEGRIVVGTNESGSAANQLNWPTTMISNDQYYLS